MFLGKVSLICNWKPKSKTKLEKKSYNIPSFFHATFKNMARYTVNMNTFFLLHFRSQSFQSEIVLVIISFSTNVTYYEVSILFGSSMIYFRIFKNRNLISDLFYSSFTSTENPSKFMSIKTLTTFIYQGFEDFSTK